MFSYEDRIKAVKLYANLVNQMLENALLLLEPGEHPIIHSDRGCHYRWPDWIHMVVQAGLVRSMSRNGCSPDNSACEGFFGRLKNEMFYGRSWLGVSLDRFMEILDNYLHWYKAHIGWVKSGRIPTKPRTIIEFGPRFCPHPLHSCFSMESSLLRLCIFQTALKNTFLWYYFLTLERAGKDMVSLGGSERIAEEHLIKIFEAFFCAITILS